MQRCWTNRNIDLELFWKKIGEFLQGKEFEVEANQSKNPYKLVAAGSPEYKIDGRVDVTLTGTPQDFSIVIELERKGKQRKYSIPITLASTLGFGLLLRDEFKSDEAFLNLKKDLWAFTDRTAINLTGSATEITQNDEGTGKSSA